MMNPNCSLLAPSQAKKSQPWLRQHKGSQFALTLLALSLACSFTSFASAATVTKTNSGTADVTEERNPDFPIVNGNVLIVTDTLYLTGANLFVGKNAEGVISHGMLQANNLAVATGTTLATFGTADAASFTSISNMPKQMGGDGWDFGNTSYLTFHGNRVLSGGYAVTGLGTENLDELKSLASPYLDSTKTKIESSLNIKSIGVLTKPIVYDEVLGQFMLDAYASDLGDIRNREAISIARDSLLYVDARLASSLLYTRGEVPGGFFLVKYDGSSSDSGGDAMINNGILVFAGIKEGQIVRAFEKRENLSGVGKVYGANRFIVGSPFEEDPNYTPSRLYRFAFDEASFSSATAGLDEDTASSLENAVRHTPIDDGEIDRWLTPPSSGGDPDAPALNALPRLALLGGAVHTLRSAAYAARQPIRERMGFGASTAFDAFGKAQQSGASLWVTPLYAHVSYKGGSTTNPSYKGNSSGIWLGFDYARENYLLGTAFFAGEGDGKSNSDALAATHDKHHFYGAQIYSSYVKDSLMLGLDFTYTLARSEVTQSSALANFSAKPDSHLASLSLSAAYDLMPGEGRLAPRVSVGLEHYSIDGYTINSDRGDRLNAHKSSKTVGFVEGAVLSQIPLIEGERALNFGAELGAKYFASDRLIHTKVDLADNFYAAGYSEISSRVLFEATLGLNLKVANFGAGLGVNYSRSADGDSKYGSVFANIRYQF